VLVHDGYVVVKIDFVHQNAKDITLPIPLLEADIYTLGGCPYHADPMEEKWYSHPPIGRSSTSGAPKQPHAPTPNPKNVKKDVAACDNPPPAPKKKRPAKEKG